MSSRLALLLSHSIRAPPLKNYSHVHYHLGIILEEKRKHMYKNARASHTIQPILAQVLNQQELFTIMHTGEPTFILLPWSLYSALRTRLVQYNYKDPQLMDAPTIPTSQLASRFLSFQKLEKAFLFDNGKCTVIFVLRRKKMVGALLQYEYYMSLIAFLQKHHISDLEPFQPQTPEVVQERRLSLVEFRNRATQLPQYFAQERHQQGGHLPFIVERQRQPELVVLSWGTWQKVLELFLQDTDRSEEDCEFINQLIMQDLYDERH